jgi:ABC-type transport system involved in multi-copper enzyme maturation permease subunit
MHSRTTRILKEARPLFWPWCAVTIAGVLSLVEQSHSTLMRGDPLWVVYNLEDIWVPGFTLGIPLLAALSFGNEFQHRTLSLVLSQPVSRMEIWGEKMSVMIAAVLSAALVFCFTGRAALQQDPELWVIAGAWMIATIASATFWTLLARSTMGGIAFNSVNCFIPLVWHLRPDWIPETMTARSAAAFAFLIYTGVMLWLGRRMLARFQVTGGLAGDDLLMAGPDVMPGAMAGWFRCRPTGAVLNLIRKELRLLRPVWLISLLGLLGWICLPIFGYTLERGSVPAVLMAVALTPLIAVLAGSLSLGEERTSGTHSWHMTLPVSARLQWLIKLVMAMFTGLVCAVLLPTLALIAGGFIVGSPLLFVKLDAGKAWLLAVALLSFASFWCACAVNGTVRAALWVFLMMNALVLAVVTGAGLAQELVALVVSRFDLFANFRFTNAVSNIQLFVPGAPPTLFVLLLLVPTLLLGVIQSYRLFRTQLQDSTLSVIRYLLPLVIVVFLSIFSAAALDGIARQADQQMWTLFRETHEAIERIQPGTANLDATHPLQLTVEDLAKAFPFSERTRRWLRDSSITVAANKPRPGPYCCGGNSRGITFVPDKDYSWYLATIHLPSGSACTVSFQAGRGYGILGGVCE